MQRTEPQHSVKHVPVIYAQADDVTAWKTCSQWQAHTHKFYHVQWWCCPLTLGEKKSKTAYSIPGLIKLRSPAPKVRCWPRTSQHFPLQRGTILFNSLIFMKTRCKMIEMMPHMTYLMNGLDISTQFKHIKYHKHNNYKPDTIKLRYIRL